MWACPKTLELTDCCLGIELILMKSFILLPRLSGHQNPNCHNKRFSSMQLRVSIVSIDVMLPLGGSLYDTSD